MYANPVLTMKEQVQQRLDRAVEHDLQAYIDNLHRIVMDIENTYHITFRYATQEAQIETKAKTT